MKKVESEKDKVTIKLQPPKNEEPKQNELSHSVPLPKLLLLDAPSVSSQKDKKALYDFEDDDDVTQTVIKRKPSEDPSLLPPQQSKLDQSM